MRKCEQDKAAIFERIHQVEVERSYRIVGALETIAREIENQVVPVVKNAQNQWMKMVLMIDIVVSGVFLTGMLVLSQWFDVWVLFSFDFVDAEIISSIKLALLLLAFFFMHFSARRFSAKVIAKKIVNSVVVNKNMAGKNREAKILAGDVKQAFLKNTQWLRSIFRPMPVGWSMRSKRVLAEVCADSSEFIQTMNDRYTRPSGNKASADVD